MHCLRDATRGGVATVLNEFAVSSSVGIRLRESSLPLNDIVRGACEILGLDPLYLANEGKLVAIVPAARARAPHSRRCAAHPAGRDAAIIGEVCAGAGRHRDSVHGRSAATAWSTCCRRTTAAYLLMDPLKEIEPCV
jgi:hydrogenase maturation factor